MILLGSWRKRGTRRGLPVFHADGHVEEATVLDGYLDQDRVAAHLAVFHVFLVAGRLVHQDLDRLPAVGALDAD